MRLAAIVLPDLGTDPDMPIIVSHWHAGRGEVVWEGDRLVEILAGPFTFDVAAPATGRLAKIRIRADEPVKPGSILGYVDPDDEDDDDNDNNDESRGTDGRGESNR